MKRLLFLAAIASTLLTRATAQSKDSAIMNNHFNHVVGSTNELSTKDLQDILGIKSWNFNVRLASPTNGVTVSLQVKREGEKPQTIFRQMLDRGLLQDGNIKAGTNLNFVLAMSPVGSMDGTGIYEAKQLRVFWKLPGGMNSGPSVVSNPFFKFHGGLAFWPFDLSPNSSGEAVIAGGNSSEGTPKQHIELVVRFEQF